LGKGEHEGKRAVGGATAVKPEEKQKKRFCEKSGGGVLTVREKLGGGQKPKGTARG